jgi:hypothetical protein
MLLGWVALAMVGCATIMHWGKSQRVTILSTPSGATATIDGSLSLATPGTISLRRGDGHLVKIEKEGFEPAQVVIRQEFSAWVLGNLLIGGLIGMFVDYGTGSAWNLEPNRIEVT